jgi:hypothetical protein
MNEQLSMLADLDRASDTREPNLCRTWKNAMLNDCDVYANNVHEFRGQKGYQYVEIVCAMEYPKVYYAFSAMNRTEGFGSYPSHYDPSFDVHEHPANVMLMVEQALAPRLWGDKTMLKLMREALDKMEKSIKE